MTEHDAIADSYAIAELARAYVRARARVADADAGALLGRICEADAAFDALVNAVGIGRVELVEETPPL